MHVTKNVICCVQYFNSKTKYGEILLHGIRGGLESDVCSTFQKMSESAVAEKMGFVLFAARPSLVDI